MIAAFFFKRVLSSRIHYIQPALPSRNWTGLLAACPELGDSTSSFRRRCAGVPSLDSSGDWRVSLRSYRQARSDFILFCSVDEGSNRFKSSAFARRTALVADLLQSRIDTLDHSARSRNWSKRDCSFCFADCGISAPSDLWSLLYTRVYNRVFHALLCDNCLEVLQRATKDPGLHCRDVSWIDVRDQRNCGHSFCFNIAGNFHLNHRLKI